MFVKLTLTDTTTQYRQFTVVGEMQFLKNDEIGIVKVGDDTITSYEFDSGAIVYVDNIEYIRKEDEIQDLKMEALHDHYHETINKFSKLIFTQMKEIADKYVVDLTCIKTDITENLIEHINK